MNIDQNQIMKAVVMEKYGTEEVIQIHDIPRPKITDNEILIEVHAAGVNPLDNKIREGKMKPLLNYKLPLVLGADIAGIVVETGSKVSKFKKGDEVYACLSTSKMGGFAQYVAVSEKDVALKPKNLTFEEASSIPLVGLTSYQALHDVAKLSSGQKILIKAGSGGIGTFAIQLAKAMGAYVATTASATNAAWVQELGADQVIDYKTQKFEKILNAYDVIFHTVDGEPTEQGINILKSGGHILSIVGPPDRKFAKKAGLNILFQALLGLLGRKMNALAKKIGATYTFVFVQPSGIQLGQITEWIEEGKIRPVIDKVFSLHDARRALAYVNQGRTKGKVVIRMNE